MLAQRERSNSGTLRALIIGAALIVVGIVLAGALPSLNPFATETVDRSQPAVLRSITRLSEYRAATANLSVIVDIEQDAKYLPAFLKGQRTLFVAAGKVDAAVDFSGLRGNAVRVTGKDVAITLPEPHLTKPQLDLQRSRVYDRDRGLLDRAASVFEDSPTEDRSVFVLAERKLGQAAAEDRGVVTAAETNTRAMLTQLLRGLGFERVTVAFTPAT